MVVPQSEAKRVKPRSSEINRKSGEVVPDGMIKLEGAPLIQVFEIYAKLKGRKADHAFAAPSAPLVFNGATTLTVDELLYALDTLFSWQYLEVVPVGDDMLRLAPISERTR